MTSAQERRRYPRCTAWLPLRLKAVGGKAEDKPITLLTQNFSKTGLCFPSPRRIELGESIEVEVTLLGAGPAGEDIDISGTGRIVRAEESDRMGWFNLAAVIDEPSSPDETGWRKLAASFQEPPE
jgi:hypothetical protein